MMRYAIYYAPARDSLLHHLGSSWLGRDAYTGEELEQPDITGIRTMTAEPARYGLHATLKAPFRLKNGVQASRLQEAVASLSLVQTSVRVANLLLTAENGFLALVPHKTESSLYHLAERCVRDLDLYRAPLTSTEIARRQNGGLTPQQNQHLLAFGYPYVLDEFKFHITLTNQLPKEKIDWLMSRAHQHFAPVIGQGLTIDCLSIFEETESSVPMTITKQFPLTLPQFAKAAS
jgi:putative phosphonate metabolism protein